MTESLLIIYAKDPGQVEVKSRLAADLGKKEAVEVYRKMLKNCLAEMGELSVDKWISYEGRLPADERKGFRQVLQKKGDLGERMRADFEKAFAAGYTKVVLTGTDIPDISGELISGALEALDTCELVLGPTFDGGYYLVGIHRDSGAERRIFSDIPWSSGGVLQATKQAAVRESFRMVELTMLMDIDTKDDLDNYRRSADPDKLNL